MTRQLAWDERDAFHLTGLTPGVAPATVSLIPGIERSSMPSPAENPAPWSPDHPVFWAGIVLALCFGLVGASTSVRVGKGTKAVKAAFDVGGK